MKIDAAKFAESIELRCWDRLAKLSWRPYEEARKWARALGLQSGTEWRKFFFKSGTLPKDVPSNPDRTYMGQGWTSWGDWLGTGTAAWQFKEYRSFSKARSWVTSLGLKSRADWSAFCKSGELPSDIPADPPQTYFKHGWKSWGDWLGSGTVASHLRQYRSFSKARSWARSLGLKSGAEWSAFCKSGKLPKDIPFKPNRTYAEHGWKNMGDWLGSGTVASYLRQYRSFSKARSWAGSLGLKSNLEWRVFCKSGQLPKDIPANPNQTYAEHGWKFSKAREWAGSLGFRSGAEWRAFCKSGRLPKNIPANPNQTYAELGWEGMGDWLGTGTVAPRLRQYRSFSKARTWARSLRLKSGAEWKAFCKSGQLPKDIPATPHNTYADQGWNSMGDWLGTDSVATHLREYRSFSTARKWARSLRLRSETEWRACCKTSKLPKDIPSNPNKTYAERGWKGMGEWLGTGTVSPRHRHYRSFSKARLWARSLGLKSQAEWNAFCKSGKLHKDIPTNPNQAYAERGWKSTGDWLGKIITS